jgi:hypothetical protein
MKYIILLLLLASCGSHLNYNVGTTHNADLQNRHRIVMKQDKIMKKSMARARKKAMPKDINKVRKKKSHKYIS